MRLKVLITAFLVLSLLGACVIAANRVKIEGYVIESRAIGTIADVVGKDAETPLFSHFTGKEFGRISIVTNVDLLTLTERLGSSLFAKMWFCSNPNVEIVLGWGVYVAGKNVQQWNLELHTSGKRSTEVGGPNLQYDLVLFQKWTTDWKIPGSFANSKTPTYYAKFDLQERPQDICISLGGGNASSTIESNVIVIPASELKQIFGDP